MKSRRVTGGGPKVVMVVPVFPQLTETFIVRKAKGLLDRGWDIQVVCDRSPATEWQRASSEIGGAPLRRRTWVRWPHHPKGVAVALLPAAVIRVAVRAPGRFARYVTRGLRRFSPLELARRFYLDQELILAGPSIIHFEFGQLACGRMHLRELLGCRVVVSFRGIDLNDFPLERQGVFAEVFAEADALHFLGRDLERRAMRLGLGDGTRRFLIPPAIDPEWILLAGTERQPDVAGSERTMELKVVTVSRLHWKKGLEWGLESIAGLRRRGVEVRYRIVGEGEHRAAVAFAIAQLGLKDCAEMLGRLPPEEVRREVAASDVLLHPAISEGFCNAVLEAQALGVPVVCSNAGGLAENVRDGETGFVVARRNAVAMADRLEQLAASPELRARIGEQGRKRASEEFPLSKQMAAFERLYLTVLADGDR